MGPGAHDDTQVKEEITKIVEEIPVEHLTKAEQIGNGGYGAVHRYE